MKCGDCREVDVGSRTGGLSRRDFLKVCSAAAVAMGLPATMGPKIAEAAAAKRLPVIWISGQVGNGTPPAPAPACAGACGRYSPEGLKEAP